MQNALFVDEQTKEDAMKALHSLPQHGVSFACAYGSRVMENKTQSQLDLLIAVDSGYLNEWHAENLERNPNHYFLSSVPYVAHKLATTLQKRPPGAFFHTFVQHPSADVIQTTNGAKSPYWKYGVIGVDDLLNDLNTWEHLFIAGRLHKPVLQLETNPVESVRKEISTSLKSNLNSAVAAALLLLPQNFSELDLFYMISSISYAGDIRLLLGAEDPNKISNMIYERPNSVNKFRILYEQSLERFVDRGYISRSMKPSLASSPTDIPIYKFEQNLNLKPEIIRNELPTMVQDQLYRNMNNLEDAKLSLQKILTNTVRKSSSKQMVNNVLMNSPLKSSKYAVAKLLKGVLRRR